MLGQYFIDILLCCMGHPRDDDVDRVVTPNCNLYISKMFEKTIFFKPLKLRHYNDKEFQFLYRLNKYFVKYKL